jgi:hypothetical protein
MLRVEVPARAAIRRHVGTQLLKWAFVLEAKAVTGQAATKAEAVAEAERAVIARK